MPESKTGNQKSNAQPYNPPAIVEVGRVEELTKGKSNQTSDTATGYKKQ